MHKTNTSYFCFIRNITLIIPSYHPIKGCSKQADKHKFTPPQTMEKCINLLKRFILYDELKGYGVTPYPM